MTNKEVIEKIWFICQEVRLGNLSEAEASEQIFESFESLGYVQKAEDQSLPEIPSFSYDKEEDRPLLQRGAINYSKLFASWVKVKEE